MYKKNNPQKELTEEEKLIIKEAFKKNLPESLGSGMTESICTCSCSCPGEQGQICDGARMVGYAGGYYGTMSATP